MTAAIIAFSLGVWWLQQQAVLPVVPAPGVWLWGVLGCVPAALLRPLRRVLCLVAAFVLGFAWAAGVAHLRMSERLAPELEGRDLVVSGVVASLPAIGARSVRFEFEVEGVPDTATRLPRKILLTWYRSKFTRTTEDQPALLEDAAGVHPGERWVFTVRLKRPHGSVNPHGFDYEAWLLERGIGATGYVRQRGGQRKLGERNSFADRVEQLREAVRTRFLGVLGETTTAGVLVALVVGDQRAIGAEDWRLFSRTGVTHLMSISCATPRVGLRRFEQWIRCLLARRRTVPESYVCLGHRLRSFDLSDFGRLGFLQPGHIPKTRPSWSHLFF